MLHSFEDEYERDKGQHAIKRVRQLERAMRLLLRNPQGAASRKRAEELLDQEYNGAIEGWVTPKPKRKKKAEKQSVTK